MKFKRDRLNLLLFFAILFSIAAPSETFKNPQVVPTQTPPASVQEGDLNGDGKPELLYTDNTTSVFNNPPVSGIHILLNQGSNTYLAGQNIPAPTPLVFGGGSIADVNGDGKPDIVYGLASYPASALGVALGNGDGTFQPLLVSALPSYTKASNSPAEFYALKIADMNGDGKPDVIFSDTHNNSVWLCLGDGLGHFTQWQNFADGNPSYSIFIGDFNRDGKPDIILNPVGRAAVYLNNNNTSFSPASYIDGPHGIASMAVADMDGDSYPDLVVNGTDNVLRLLHGNTNATFTATLSLPVQINSGMVLPVVLDAEDYNHDGILDLALETDDGVHIFIGQGSFQFVPLQPAPIARFPGLGAIGDLNQDTLVDFVFPVPGGLAILYGQPDGSLHSADSYDVRYSVQGSALADFNEDGRQDVIVGIVGIYPRVLLGNADGSLTLLPDTNNPSALSYGQGPITTGDFNGDGHADYVSNANSPVLGQTYGAVYSLGNGDGTFGTLKTVPGETEFADYGTAVGDLNNDGRTDISAQEYGATIEQFFLGQPDGSFKQTATVSSPFNSFAPSAYADFNKDGYLDAAIVGGGEIQIENGRGDGTFATGFVSTAGATPGTPNDAMAVDIDGDGNLDIVSPIDYGIQIFYGHGDGTFDAPALISLAMPPPSLQQVPAPYSGINSADLDGDGIPDLVLTNGDLVTIVHGIGNRQFGSSQNYLAGASTAMPRIADFNGDGRPDILITNASNTTSTVTVLLNIPDADDVSGKLTAIPEPSTFPQPFTIQLNLSAAIAASGIPIGTVTFALDGVVLGSTPINNAGASFAVNTQVPAGTHVLTASYSGDATFHAATFTAQHRIIVPAAATQAALTVAPNPSSYGQPVQFTATVQSGAAVQGGSVTFIDGTAPLATQALGPAGSATFSTSALQVGTHAISASYSGASGYQSSVSNTVSLRVQPDATTTTLTSNVNPALVGTNVTFTASVANAIAGAVAPSGNVTFYDGSANLGSATLNGNGTATYITNALSVGTHSITAAYPGTSTTMASTSAVLQQAIVAIVGDFSMDVAPGAASIYTGIGAHFKVVVSPLNGFNQTVALSCSGLPAETTCVFKPASISGGSGLSQLTVQTSPPHPIKAAGIFFPMSWRPMAMATALLSMALLLLPIRLRALRLPFKALAVTLLMTAMSACGGPGPAGGGTPPGNYSISINGTAPPLAHSTTVFLTIKSFF